MTDQTVTQELYFSSIGEMPVQTHRGKPCCGLQGFPMELTTRVIPCCIVRIFEECRPVQFFWDCVYDLTSAEHIYAQYTLKPELGTIHFFHSPLIDH